MGETRVTRRTQKITSKVLLDCCLLLWFSRRAVESSRAVNNRDLTKLRRRRQRKRQQSNKFNEQNNNSARACTTTTWHDHWEILSWLENGNGKAINFTFFIWNRTRSHLFSSMTWYKAEKVVKDAKSIFQRRFHWRRRCRKVSNRKL